MALTGKPLRLLQGLELAMCLNRNRCYSCEDPRKSRTWPSSSSRKGKLRCHSCSLRDTTTWVGRVLVPINPRTVRTNAGWAAGTVQGSSPNMGPIIWQYHPHPTNCHDNKRTRSFQAKLVKHFSCFRLGSCQSTEA